MHEGQGPALLTGHGKEAIGDVADPIGGRYEPVDPVGVVAIEAMGHRGDGGDGAGDTDEAARLTEWHELGSAIDRRLDIDDRCLDLRGGRRVIAHMALRHADTPDVDTAHRTGPIVTEHELRRSPAEVDHQDRANEPGKAIRRTGEGECGLLLTGDDLRLDADAGAHSRDEFGAVACIAARRGRDEAQSFDAELAHDRRVLVDGCEGPREGSRAELPRAIDALTEPDRAHLAHQVATGLAHEQPDRIRAQIDGRDHGHGVSGSWVHGALHQYPSMAATTSSPRGFTPGPLAKAWAASTCRHFTRSGMPPAEMPAISGT